MGLEAGNSSSAWRAGKCVSNRPRRRSFLISGNRVLQPHQHAGRLNSSRDGPTNMESPENRQLSQWVPRNRERVVHFPSVTPLVQLAVLFR